MFLQVKSKAMVHFNFDKWEPDFLFFRIIGHKAEWKS